MRKYLKWVYVFSKSSSSERARMKEQLLEGLKKFPYAKAIAEKKNPSKELIVQANEMVESMRSSRLEFIGFSPVISYFREKGRGPALEALYTHDFGGPSLLYKVKDLPILIIANPTIRLDDSYLRDIPQNLIDDDITGVTD